MTIDDNRLTSGAFDIGDDDAEVVAEVGRELAARQSTPEKVVEALRTARLYFGVLRKGRAVQ